MKQLPKHPSHQFSAPSSIQHGVPLKALLNSMLVSLIGQSLIDVVPRFDLRAFERNATRGLDDLELKERASHIANAMREQLPANFDAAVPLLIQSFGPPLTATEGNGLAVFFYMPHAHLIADYGLNCFDSSMKANYEITQRFTAEFSIRPFLIKYRSKCLKLLKRWTSDANPHVRRLVSEGTRPRLPWAMRLPEFQQDPGHTLPLLEALKDDPELYVRRSVANHLGDVAKDHPDAVFDLCERWLEEIQPSDELISENRRWVIRHALRHPAKKESKRATHLRTLASPSKRRRSQK